MLRSRRWSVGVMTVSTYMSSDTEMCARVATGSSVDLVLDNNVGSGL